MQFKHIIVRYQKYFSLNVGLQLTHLACPFFEPLVPPTGIFP